VLFAYEKTSARVIGDGATPLARLAGRGGDGDALRAHDGDGRLYGAEDVAPDGAVLTIEGARNRAVGGGALTPVTDAPAPLAELARGAAAALGLELAAVDLFDRPAGPVIIEVNSSPAIETLEAYGRWDLIEAIWSANIEAALAAADAV
jgi:RimK-like ATP-grasp domain